MIAAGVAEASKITYRHVEASGQLTDQQRRIVEFLEARPRQNFTRKEIARALGMEHSTCCARVNELLDPVRMANKVRVRELPHRRCSLSGRTASPLQILPGQLGLFS